MGITEPGYSENLVDRIATNLNLHFTQSSDVNIPEGPFYSTLRIRLYVNGTNQLCTYELTWSPLTATIKTNAFALDWAPEQVSSRQAFNNTLKIGLMDQSLSDVVLYVGKFRPMIQLPITNAIFRIVSDSSPNDPIAILTHSLAGYMVIDTLSSMYDSDSGKGVAHNYAEHVRQIFMMANQMPILNLSDQTNFVLNCGGISGKLEHILADQSFTSAEPNHIQIVAFSDPNDLLSYKLRQCDIQQESEPMVNGMPGQQQPKLIFPSNVDLDGFNVTYTVNPWSILGVFSWPVSAHNDWWTDSAVPGFLAFGHQTTN